MRVEKQKYFVVAEILDNLSNQNWRKQWPYQISSDEYDKEKINVNLGVCY